MFALSSPEKSDETLEEFRNIEEQHFGQLGLHFTWLPDYQSRRLNIKYKIVNEERFVHTLNGTACAIAQMLITLTETSQSDKGFIEIPKVLQKYMQNKDHIARQKKVPELKLMKHKT